MMAGSLYALGYFAYQFGSAWRKDVTGKIDSPGLDVIDLTAPAGIVAAATWVRVAVAIVDIAAMNSGFPLSAICHNGNAQFSFL